MKKSVSIFFFLLVFSFAVQAQGFFEGKIVFGMEYEGTGMSMLSSLMPNEMVFQFRDEDMTYEIQGGMMASMMGKFLLQGSKGKMYMIKESEKVAYEFTEESLKESGDKVAEKKPMVTALDEQSEIMGYACKKYKIVTQDEEGTPVTQYIWATEELKIRQPKAKMGEAAGISQFSLEEKGVKGFPLRIETLTQAGGIDMTILMVAKEVDTHKPDRQLFTFDSDYEVKEFDASKMMGN